MPADLSSFYPDPKSNATILAYMSNYDIVVTLSDIVKALGQRSNQLFRHSLSPMDKPVTVSIRAPGTGHCAYDLRARAALQESAATEWRKAWRFRGTGERRRYCISDWTV